MDSQHKVLIVEDDKANQMILGAFLKNLGYSFDLASDGKQGLEHIQNYSYDIVFMDINIPIMSGLEVVAQIRKMDDVYFKTLPIVVITSSFADDAEKMIKEYQLTAYVSKPINPNDVKSILEKYVSENTGSQISSTNSTKNGLFNYSKLKALSNGNAEQMADIVGTIAHIIPSEIDKIKLSIDYDDFDSIRISAHKIKPNYEYVGLTDLAMLSAQIERIAENRNKPALIPLIDKLNAESNKIIPELKAAKFT